MTKYKNVHIPIETIESLTKKLEKNGLIIRSDAEAVNTVINNFLLEKNLEGKKKNVAH
jgi:hypothetical protein